MQTIFAVHTALIMDYVAKKTTFNVECCLY